MNDMQSFYREFSPQKYEVYKIRLGWAKKVLDCPVNNMESASERHSENNNDKQPDSPKGGEMELEAPNIRAR